MFITKHSYLDQYCGKEGKEAELGRGESLIGNWRLNSKHLWKGRKGQVWAEKAKLQGRPDTTWLTPQVVLELKCLSELLSVRSQ